MIENLQPEGFDVLFLSHAKSILAGDFAAALTEIAAVLQGIALPITEIIGSGGGETKFTQRLRKSLADMGWEQHVFEIGKTIDGVQRESTSHEVDHVKRFGLSGGVAMEIEWNNKDPFYDRDLENFKRLHAEGAISVAVIVTRGRYCRCKMGFSMRCTVSQRNATSRRWTYFRRTA
ncbi:MAG: BglII/BstYI family type II restriction endonuclease [Betaproteobacteria bacterium]